MCLKSCNFRCIMRGIISILLSSLLLLQNVNIGASEVLRVGNLLEHAQLHSEKYGDSVLSFLTKHYGASKKVHLTSHEGHENLPFNHNSLTKSTLSVFIFNPLQALELPLLSPTTPSLNFFYGNSYSSYVNLDYFQPPRKA